MNVSLTPELETLVAQKVKTGRYSSASEVVREALRLFDDFDNLREIRLNKLRNEIQKGVDSLKAGESETFTTPEELLERVREGAKKKIATNRNGKTK